MAIFLVRLVYKPPSFIVRFIIQKELPALNGDIHSGRLTWPWKIYHVWCYLHKWVSYPWLYLFIKGCVYLLPLTSCSHTVDGRMEEILHQLIGSLSHDLSLVKFLPSIVYIYLFSGVCCICFFGVKKFRYIYTWVLSNLLGSVRG